MHANKRSALRLGHSGVNFRPRGSEGRDRDEFDELRNFDLANMRGLLTLGRIPTDIPLVAAGHHVWVNGGYSGWFVNLVLCELLFAIE